MSSTQRKKPRDNKNKYRASLFLPDDLRISAKVAAARDGLSLTQWVSNLVRIEVEKREKRERAAILASVVRTPPKEPTED